MLRPATARDVDAIRGWRNHPDVRAASMTSHVITPDEHAGWWAASQHDPTRRVLVYEHHEVPSGVVTFFDHDPAARSAWWGFYLDVEGLDGRGELLPAWLAIERDAIRYAFGELGLDVLEGEVLASNESVRQLNRRHRFSEIGSTVRDIAGQPVDVVHMRLRAADVRSH